MAYVIIPLVSAVAAALTLLSGFGLGTVLVPLFAIFFPVEIGIAAASIVHFVNNLFKLGLVGKFAKRDVVLRFGIPAVFAALLGASLMTIIIQVSPIVTYRIGPLGAEVTWFKIILAVLLALFAGLELWPKYQKISFPPSALPIGGLLSGFFGGISGMQGALRAPFLLRVGLTKEQFVGTGNVISTVVDMTRLLIYAVGFIWLAQRRDYAAFQEWRTLWLVLIACIAGIVGSYVGARLLKKVTLRVVQILVAVLLFASAVALGAGII